MKKIGLLLFVALVFASVVYAAPQTTGGVYRTRFQSAEGYYLTVEVLDDDLAHFELSMVEPLTGVDEPIFTTPMVAKTDYAGPSQITDDGSGLIETPQMRIAVDEATLCVTLTYTVTHYEMTTLCPYQLTERRHRGLAMTVNDTRQVYGLGEDLNVQGGWMGAERTSPFVFGNVQTGFSGGNAGNDQFPIMYALAEGGGNNYAMFVDHSTKQTWNFQADPWHVEMRGDPIRWYMLAGPNLPDLRQDYMELTGRPPVPPKKAFGLWVSEYGYENWDELLGVLDSLEAAQFPVDGFVLDLQWFGGIGSGSRNSRMGSLDWDETNFPNPAQTIAQLDADHGVGIVVIEEPYVQQGLPDYETMTAQNYLVDRCGDPHCESARISGWWGQGGMVDFSDEAAGDTWHDLQRQPLIEAGVVGHWTDLGEPELLDAEGWYVGFPNVDWHSEDQIHNLYNLLWAQSIARGYERNSVIQRPWILSRSGTSGIQRFGAAMWSGDIATNIGSLRGHLQSQTQMSFSGVDYYGADIGGFLHQNADPDTEFADLYTIWFAHGMLLDVPGRPHTMNLGNSYETAPSLVGDTVSNLANVRQRYALSPYVYSLAHRANLYGEPVFPPLVYYYQGDPNVLELSTEKMIGQDLLVATVADYGQTTTRVYLPVGTWINYHTNEIVESSGEWIEDVPLIHEGAFQLPVFVRQGAVLPQMFVDDQTMNIFGRRRDGTTHDELIVRVYPSVNNSRFTLYEDDGRTTAYENGDVRTTVIEQFGLGVEIKPAEGTYAGALDARNNVIAFVTTNPTSQVMLNGEPLTPYTTQADFDAAESGWYADGNGVIWAKSGVMSVTETKRFAF